MTTEKIPGWIERLLLPKLSEISGDVKGLDIKIESLRNETKTEIASVRNEIASLRTEMNVRLDSIEKRIPVIEKITALEIKIADLEKRLAAA
jgi:hypothetical protein